MLTLPPANSRRAAALAVIPMAVGVALSRPNLDAYQAAWIAFAPALLWASAAPSRRLFAVAAYLGAWAAELVSILWMRHLYPPLGLVATLLGSAYVAVYPWLFLLAARAALPRARNAPFANRASVSLGLAGLWVALEWVRGHVFSGYPWMLLGATQWKAVPLFAVCPWTGPWGPSFILILFNLALVHYARWIVRPSPGSAPISPWRGLRLCPDFYLALAPVALCVFLFLSDLAARRASDERLFTFAAVQTDFDPNAKWSSDRAAENRDTVTSLTRAAATLDAATPFLASGTPSSGGAKKRGDADFILWPEAALPFSIGRPGYDGYLASLARETRTPMLVGAITSGPNDGYYNSVNIVTPEDGVLPEFYAKRHLVPFGEYVPYADILPLRKVVPIDHDSLRGESDAPLTVRRRDGAPLRLGALVCYEDVFPELARGMALRGADALLVVTNDAWYGREAGAYQHAASCAILAASTGLPVARCGNAGWSGVIAPNGHASAITDGTGSIYFRGVGRAEVRGTPAAARRPNFYVRAGDWFPAVCAGLAALMLARTFRATRR